jgi:MFS family permease
MCNRPCDAAHVRAAKQMLGDSARALRSVFANPGLRRIELARAAGAIAVSAYAIVFVVVAYEAGGAAAVGLVAAVRMFAVSVVSPFGAMLGDRFARKGVMVVSDLARTGVLIAAAIAVAAEPTTAAVVGLAALASVTGTASGPARAALMPSLARTPEELAAANVAGTTTESVASLLGPTLGGFLLALAEPEVAFAGAAVLSLLSAVIVARIAVDETRREEARPRRRRLSREALEGFRTVVAQPGARAIVALYSVESLAVGIFGVAMIAAVIDVLELGQSGVGFASAVMSVGGLVGAVIGLALGGRRLAVALGGGVLLWGVAVALVGAWPEPAFALVLLGVAGLGDTVADASGITILQRTIPEEVLSRAFGALAMILWGAAALGAVVAPALIELLGIRGTLVATGAPVALLALVAWGALRRADAAAAPSPALELLRAVPLFALLPLPALERLAAAASPVQVRARGELVRQGQPGDRFYIVESGEVDVTVDGRGVATLGRGDHFGEIALLHDVPRTATVTARGDAGLYTLEREEFVGAVTGDAASLEAANAAIGSRLARDVESAAAT